MNKLKTWMIAAAGALIFLAVGALEDGPDQEQMAADELKAAQVQARVEAAKAKRDFKARQAYAGHLLALDHLK